MIVKILSSNASFNGVRYNMDKTKDRGAELMKVENFGAIQGIDGLRPEDYKNYLKSISVQNGNIKNPQFHVVISCKGNEFSKDKLTEIAEQWLKGMGYAKQPYLIVFHSDTSNNHVHVVSTRIDKEGKKISDSFEKLKSYQVLNKIIGIERDHIKDIDKALSYQCSTAAQWMMLLEQQGYTIKKEEEIYQVIKFGKILYRVEALKIQEQIKFYKKDHSEINRLKAIFNKYKVLSNTNLILKTERLAGRESQNGRKNYTSALCQMLENKFGLQFIFHAKDGKLPYGYTVIDHSKKTVYKGSEIMSLQELLQNSETLRRKNNHGDYIDTNQRTRYTIQTTVEQEVLSKFPINGMEQSFSKESLIENFIPMTNINIADDIDDEAIHGRNRERKRKSRTNTR